MSVDIGAYKAELEKELDGVLSYWIKFTTDPANGGFYGKVDNDNKPDPRSAKGLVLNSRILWSFSAAYNATKKQEYFFSAARSFQYLTNFFFDREYGGAFWSVDCIGNVHNGRKQIYGLAFCIYGMSEFYRATGNEQALQFAKDIFEVIEKYSYDKFWRGYFEAFARDWRPLEDLRLSEKDDNENKTTNTHLHIIEAYSNLYEVWEHPFLKTQVENLLDVFSRHMISAAGHLKLFFDAGWKPGSSLISYGHDIEAGWLLQQCAEKIRSSQWIRKTTHTSVTLAIAAAQGLDSDGGLWYEFDAATNRLTREKHWWPQAEAMIGFMNAFEITQDEHYLQKSYNSWRFIQTYIKDRKKGEWFWGVNADYSIMQNQDKAGFWKCPYHNSRACLEMIRRLGAV